MDQDRLLFPKKTGKKKKELNIPKAYCMKKMGHVICVFYWTEITEDICFWIHIIFMEDPTEHHLKKME